IAIIIANLFVLLALAALLLDCRFPCDWTNSTIVSLESRLRSVHLTNASLRGSFYSIVLQEFSKIVCSWNFQVFCGATSSSSSITHASSLPAYPGAGFRDLGSTCPTRTQNAAKGAGSLWRRGTRGRGSFSRPARLAHAAVYLEGPGQHQPAFRASRSRSSAPVHRARR